MDAAREYLVPHSTAKWARSATGSYMVGALARFNLNFARLHPLARQVAGTVGLEAPSTNPFHNNLAQLVEVAHSLEDSIRHIDRLLDTGLAREPYPTVEPRPGKGVGAVEVPRGLLFHAYEYDDEGRIVQADCVIPTNQNHANIQEDLDALTPDLSGRSEAEIELTLSMLVRAYDPCISCSTHLIDLNGQAAGRGVRFVQSGSIRRGKD
jgi:coenzyme F420-reducing hydrogenase alpha subunit